MCSFCYGLYRNISIFRWCYSNTKFRFSSNYKDTLHLPKTLFPHKVNPANRLVRDEFIEKKADFNGLYEWQLEHNKKALFVLHDGPPYANGDVHIGHAVNKILKDISLRYRMISGKKIHFVPGWDCHGLPIELKVLKGNKQTVPPLQIRKKAFEFSQQTKNAQLVSFKKWGLVADWKNCYMTCHPNYVIKQLKVFQKLYEKGIIFQDSKPVYWSPWNRTSLAEAELEFNLNHVSPSVYLKLPLVKCSDFIKSKLDTSLKLNLLVWTTTPWTLPANQAVCYAANKRYCIVFYQRLNEYFVIAQDMVSSLESLLDVKLEHVDDFEGSLLQSATYLHPVYKDHECFLLSGHHVTMNKGTGLVHTAPNHGFEDFIVAQNHSLPIKTCLVDETGCYTKDAGQIFAGKNVLNDGNELVLELLKDDVLWLENFTHSYPYDWRSNKPVIIRCSRQWFIDVKSIKEKAMQCLQNLVVVPEHLRKTFLSQLDASPQWCISRQRVWGVPIPAFYNREGNKPFVHRAITEHLCNLVQEKGIHVWWELSLNELLPPDLKTKCNLPSDVLCKGEDIMDIWLDSGISWMTALEEPQIADVCIEGIDQIRGWFNSSLLTSVAIRGIPPYKKLFLHGFTTDADGFKMSKSKGNVVSPTDITHGSKKMNLPALGVDTLRWWVAFHACQHENIAVKAEILEESARKINKLRNTLKFLLGSLYEFDVDTMLVKPTNMRVLDLYMLHLLHNFSVKIQNDYEEMQYKLVAKDIINFVTNDISSFYCELIKDRLYCDAQHSHERLSCQTVLFFIFTTLIQSIAPLTPHLAEEAFFHHPKEEFANNGAFRSHFINLAQFLGKTSFPQCIIWANEIKERISTSEMKMSNMDVYIIGSTEVLHQLKHLNEFASGLRHDGLCELLQAAKVFLCKNVPQNMPQNAISFNGSFKNTTGDEEHYTVILLETQLKKCPRCRRYCTVDNSILCDRCLMVVNEIRTESQNCK